MPDDPIWRGSLTLEQLGRGLKRTFAERATRGAAGRIEKLAKTVAGKATTHSLHTNKGRDRFARQIATRVLASLLDETADRAPADGDPAAIDRLPFFPRLVSFVDDFIADEGLFHLPAHQEITSRSALWQREDALLAVSKRLDQIDTVEEQLGAFTHHLIEPLVRGCPALLDQPSERPGGIVFQTPLIDNLSDLPAVAEHMLLLPFAPELDELGLTGRLKERLEYNLTIASGGTPGRAQEPPACLRRRAG